ncbi:retrovirus-related pol polyprotein from transposon TNT 1-94 [Tanacetum coccineum]
MENGNRVGNSTAEVMQIGNMAIKIKVLQLPEDWGHLCKNCKVRPRRRMPTIFNLMLLIAQKEEAGIQLQAEEFDLMAATADLDEIEEVNANCILMANLQQSSHQALKVTKLPSMTQTDKLSMEQEAAKFVRDFQSLAKEADESLAKHKALELEIERLLRAVVSQDIMSIVQNNSVVDTSNLQTELERTKERFENCIIKKENEYAKLWNDWFQNKKTTPKVPQKVDKMNDLSNPVTSNSVPTTKESKVLENDKVIAPGMFRINLFKNSREKKYVPNKPIKASVRTNPITVSEPHVITKKVVYSDSNGFSYTGVDITTKTRRPQPRSNTNNDRVPSASESSHIKNKEVEVEEHPRNLLLSKNKKHMSSECNNVKLAIRNDKSKILCDMCKQCLITANHDVYVLNYVNGMNSHGKKQKENVSNIANQTKHKPQVKKPKKVGYKERLASSKPCKPRMCLRVYFVEGLRHDRFSVGQFYYLDLEVAFRRNTCFVRNLEGVDLLKGNRTTNLYTINLHDMASASPIFLMARATSTKSWLWHQRLSYLNFDTINDLARNDLITGLPKFKYHKEHLCPSSKQGKNKRASHPPKPVPNSKQRLHLLHMDLCGPMRIASISRTWYVLVIVDDYSRYTWVLFPRSKDEAPKEIKIFLKKITVLLQALVIVIRTNNSTKFKNQVLKEYLDSVGISHQASSVRTSQQNGVVERRNRTLVEAARTMLIFSRALLFLWAKAIATACYTQNHSIIHR